MPLRLGGFSTLTGIKPLHFYLSILSFPLTQVLILLEELEEFILYLVTVFPNDYSELPFTISFQYLGIEWDGGRPVEIYRLNFDGVRLLEGLRVFTGEALPVEKGLLSHVFNVVERCSSTCT